MKSLATVWLPVAQRLGSGGLGFAAWFLLLTFVVPLQALAQTGNVAPVANGDSYTMSQGGTLNIAAPGVLANDNDANGDALTARWVTSPSVGTVTFSSSGAFSYSPPAGFTGNVSFAYRAWDPSGARSARATVSIAVVGVGSQAPQITTAPVSTATVGVGYSYDVNATDPNGDTLTYSLTQAPSGMAINASNGVIAWTPSSTQTGSQAVTVRVADPGGLAVMQAFSIAVAGPANAPPQITTTPVTTASVGTAYSYDVNATDPNGDTLTYSLTQAPGGMTINASTGLIGWTPSSTQTGSQSVTARAADPAGLAVTQTFAISVAGGTAPPTITRVDLATPATHGAAAGSMDAITLNWYRLPMATNYLQFMHLVNASGQTWSVDDHWTTSTTWTAGPFTQTRTITVPAGLPAGSYDIRVGLSGGTPWVDLLLAMGPGVTDPSTDHRYKVGTLTVGSPGNQAPQISTTAVTAAIVGAAYSYDVNATDPNSDTLTYSLTQAPSGMAINASNGLIAWTPSSAQTGSQAVTVRVADPGGLAVTQAFSIAVAAGGSGAPQITTAPVTTATAGVPYSYDVNATDPNADTLSYSLTQAPGGMTISASNGLIAWTPSSAQVGAQAVTVRVADPGGLAAAQPFSITVGTTSPPPPGPMTMSCADGVGYQCGGEAILRTDNGVALTRSGVQVAGRSTSDMSPSNPNVSGATGLVLISGGMAEIRVRKDSNAAPSGVAVLLSNLGIFWSGQTDRPQIIETFTPTVGRVQLDAGGALLFGSLPPRSDLSYFDYAYLGSAATRPNYGNNRYFPRTEPPRCVPGGWCATLETTGPQFGTGAWRSGGSDADMLGATRYHEDGDIHAGNGLPDANGNPTWLPGGSGLGVPVPGSKGYRTLNLWNYRYANLASWFTQDTVNINEWGGVNEHNKNRRGVVAFGDTTDPAVVPSSGSATYVGVVHGRYAPNGTDDPVPFAGTVLVTANFGTRSVTVSIQNTVRNDGSNVSVPIALTATAVLGTSANANYLTSPAISAGLNGGLSGRFFGPVVAGGTGAGPSELGGAFALSNSGTGAAVVAGFIARKQ